MTNCGSYGTLKSAYEGVESASNFKDVGAIRAYRETALKKSEGQVSFIRAKFSSVNSVLEACCGNGRLLFALRPHVERLNGFDLAASRIDFARRWARDVGTDTIGFWVDDLLDPGPRLRRESAQLVVCITGAFGYFDAFGQGLEEMAARNLADRVAPGGGLLLELYQLNHQFQLCTTAPDHELRIWCELPESDPFRYYLSKYILDLDRAVLTHSKIFVGRDGTIDDARFEKIRIYKSGEIGSLFAPWFEYIGFASDWTGTPYVDGRDETMIVFAWGRRKTA
jgi:SAM-dependent methyltransferase